MDRTCNIDAKGRAVRLLTGIFAILAGLILAILVNLGTLSFESYWLLVSGSIIGGLFAMWEACLLYTSPSPRDRQKSRMPSSA